MTHNNNTFDLAKFYSHSLKCLIEDVKVVREILRRV